MQCRKTCYSAGLRLVIKLVIFLQSCRARLPGNAAGQCCRARLHAMLQYAESMVKLAKNAVFEQSLYKKNKNKNNKARLRPASKNTFYAAKK
jgi:hypothetical protein